MKIEPEPSESQSPIKKENNIMSPIPEASSAENSKPVTIKIKKTKLKHKPKKKPAFDPKVESTGLFPSVS